MGWVGAGTLIATAAYFLYRHQLRSTSNSPSPSRAPQSDSPASPANESLSRQEAGPSTLPTPETEEDTSQTTPKASATSAPTPQLAVPVLNLDEDIAIVAAEPPASQSMSGQKPAPVGQNGEASETKTMQPPTPPSSSSVQSQQTSAVTGANTSSSMPPPTVPRLRPTAQPSRPSPTGQLQPPRLSAGNSLAPPPSAASGLRVPTNAGSRLSSSTLAPTQAKKAASRKVVLEPGYSPLDWAALTSNPNNQLRGEGLPPVLRVTPSMLKEQNGRKGRDAWTSYQGKVYNITPYLPYHPGGKGELLRGAGKDSAKLFQEIHPWVNWDGILRECMVGILVSENDSQTENNLDAMD